MNVSYWWILNIGIIGFIIVFLYDLASIKRIKYRLLIALGGYGTHAFAVYKAAFAEKTATLPEWVLFWGWPVFLTGLSWLLYCILIFPPIMQSYLNKNDFELSKEGPYAFSRHPGFVGYVFFIFGLAMVTRSFLLLKCGVIWIICDLAHILLQDKWIFRILFSGYEQYSRTTPMLFPNAKSLRLFFETISISKMRKGL